MDNPMQQDLGSTDMAEQTLSGQEQAVLSVIRKIGFGEVKVVIKDNAIVMIEERKTIKP
ncbi:MAG: DUF2292 domain-containing protein [Clostridiales bacterium]|nr:DUF2292 domain-containing protein [Clostridiales bacterium]